MSHRQTVAFLRRRYAAAILCDDADTAGRLRAQLDGLMNPAAGRPGAAPQAEAAGPSPPPPIGSTPPLSDGLGPRLHLVAPVVTPVTGLLDRPRRAS